MSEGKLIPVGVVIGDRNYRVRVEANEEEHLRKTVKLINEKILEFKTTLAGKDMQDYISMVTLWYATQANSGITNALDELELQDGLEKISRLIDRTLAEEKRESL